MASLLFRGAGAVRHGFFSPPATFCLRVSHFIAVMRPLATSRPQQRESGSSWDRAARDAFETNTAGPRGGGERSPKWPLQLRPVTGTHRGGLCN